MDIRDYIKVADAFGTETRKLAELKEGELADRIAQDLGWDLEDGEAIEQSVEDTGNDPAELASVIEPDAQQSDQGPFLNGMVITSDIQQRLDAIGRDRGVNGELLSVDDISALNSAVQSGEITAPTEITTGRNSAPAQPAGAEPEAPAGAELEAPAGAEPEAPAGAEPEAPAGAEPEAPAEPTATRPQGDSAADVAQDDAARAQGGDALAGRLDTQTPSLLDAYNDGGRQALDSVRDLQTALSRLGFDPNGIDGKYGRGTYAAVQEFQRQNGLTVDGEAGPTTMAKLQELLNGGAGEDQPQGDPAVDAETDDAARQAPQTDAENATPAQPPQTDAENDTDSADNTTPQQIDPEALAAVRRVDNPSRVGTDAGDGLVWIIGNGNFFTRTRPDNPKVAAQQAAAASLRSQQNNSKEFDMKKFIKESRELEECGPEMSMPQNEGNPVTMSVTLNASGEQHVQDLIRMMQLAGAKDATPVSAMHVGPSVDKHDDMVSMMRMMDTPEESVEEEWDNAPEEDYRDHKHMTKDLSGGLNREKKAYAKAQDGDNAMAVESIKDQLLQALKDSGYDK